MRRFTWTLLVVLCAAITVQATPPVKMRPPSIGSPSDTALGMKKNESKGLFGGGLTPFWRKSSTSTNASGFRPWFSKNANSTTSASSQKPFLQRLFGGR